MGSGSDTGVGNIGNENNAMAMIPAVLLMCGPVSNMTIVFTSWCVNRCVYGGTLKAVLLKVGPGTANYSYTRMYEQHMKKRRM